MHDLTTMLSLLKVQYNPDANRINVQQQELSSIAQKLYNSDHLFRLFDNYLQKRRLSNMPITCYSSYYMPTAKAYI